MNAVKVMLTAILLTQPVYVQCQSQILIFGDGFETGDVSQWSSTNEQLCGYAIRDRNMPVPQHMTIAGLPNVLSADVVTVTAGSEGASMTASQLKDWHNPSKQARLTSVAPHLSYWETDATISPIEKVQQLGLGNYTLVPGDQIRKITMNDDTALPPVRSQSIPPIAVLSTGNYDGTAVGGIDEHPSTPDGTYAGPNVLSQPGWSVYLTFDSPASAAATGADCQVFLMWVRSTGAPATPEDIPTVRAALVHSGTTAEIANLGTKLITSTTGQFLIFSFDAADGIPDGSPVVLSLEFSAGLILGSGQHGELGAIAWEALYQTDKNIPHYDTGWHTLTGAEIESDFGNTALQEVDEPTPIFRVFIEPRTVARARVELRGDGVGYFTDFASTPPRTPATFIDAGFAILHPIYEFPFQFMDDGSLEWLDTYVGEDETALDGSDNKVLLHRRRQCTVTFDYMPKSKAEALFKRLKGDQPILVSLFPNNGIESGDLYTFLATASRLDPHTMSNYTRDGELTRSIGYTLTEKLG